MINPTRFPDFYVVGAPKCGTTALYHQLKSHPEIFLPQIKEPHYFGEDLTWRTRVIERERYAALYEEVPSDALAGDMSVFYLLSKSAAREINRVKPAAKIVAIVRDPMKMIPSLHAQALKTGDERHNTLASAFAAEPDRRAGQVDIDAANPGVQEMLFYSEIAKYAEQIQRYIDVFGRDQVHIVLFDALMKNQKATIAEILSFLGVDNTFEITNERHNERVSISNRFLWRFAKHPPPWARKLWRTVIPRKVRSAVLHKATCLYLAPGEAAAPTPEERQMIIGMYRDEIPKLEALLGVRLPTWLAA